MVRLILYFSSHAVLLGTDRALIARSCFRIGRCQGVIPEPEVKEISLSVDDVFIILGSDGLWAFISPQEAVDLVWREIHLATVHHGLKPEAKTAARVEAAAEDEDEDEDGAAREKQRRQAHGASRACELLEELARER